MVLLQMIALRLIFGPAYIVLWFTLILLVGIVAAVTFLLAIVAAFMQLAD